MQLLTYGNHHGVSRGEPDELPPAPGARMPVDDDHDYLDDLGLDYLDFPNGVLIDGFNNGSMD